MTFNLRRLAPIAAIVGLPLAVTASSIATPPSGQTTTTPVLGTLQREKHIDTDGIKFRTSGAAQVATFTLTLDPGGFTGWHTHPGILIATVQSGTVVRQVGCRSHTYRPGEVFVEHGDQPTGQVTNPSPTEPAAFSVTQIAPLDTPRREESEPPTCKGPHGDSDSE
jgi:quercetin dioxygenase-like cupin family protein